MLTRTALVTLLASALVVPLTAAPAEAAPAVRFRSVQYDSPGSDTYSNSSLNAEWIKVTNYSNRARNLGGWRIRDEAGHSYRFPAGFRLGAGNTVQVHTGDGGNTSAHRYWGMESYVWNNTGDTATLRNSSGGKVHACSWGDGSGSKSC